MHRGGDDGLTLVEMVVAMAIVVVGVLGMLTEVVSYVRDQSTQRAHATALRLATTTLEDARSVSSDSLTGTSQTTTGSNGIAYTTSTTVNHCLASSSTQATCTTATGSDSVARITVTVSWTDGHGSHQISLSSSSANLSASTLPGSSGSLADNLTGTSGTSVSAGALTLNPSSTSVDSSGDPVNNVTATLSVVGLSSGTTMPLTWIDDTGSHQVTLTNTGGATWSATIPKSSITRAVTSGSKTIAFTATVPGIAAPVTATLTLVPLPAFNGNCSVTVSPIVTLLRKTTVPEVLSCSTTGLASSDHVQATYASGSGTASASLSSLDGSTWTATLPSGTAMVGSGSSESFTFTLTRSSDGYTRTQSLSVALA